jgi:hypothetical protein
VSQTEQGFREAFDVLTRQVYNREGDIINAFIAMLAVHSGKSILDFELVIERRWDGSTKYWLQPKENPRTTVGQKNL